MSSNLAPICVSFSLPNFSGIPSPSVLYTHLLLRVQTKKKKNPLVIDFYSYSKIIQYNLKIS